MSSNGTRKLFDEVDTNHDGKIDRKELSRWTRDRRNGDVTISSPKMIKRNFSTRSRGGADFVGDAGANAVFDRMDSNRNNVIERSKFNRFARNGSMAVNKSSTAKYISRYRVDSRGFFVDPNPEIIIRPNPNPPATYKQKIIIRYLRPPPLRQVVVSDFFLMLLFVL
jgi:Ca2+-binding EF-hand superfamily protein